MDARLRWHQRLAVRLHLLYCVWCRRYAAQIRFLRKATRELAAAEVDGSTPKLSPEAKAEMRKRLQAALEPPLAPPSLPQ